MSVFMFANTDNFNLFKAFGSARETRRFKFFPSFPWKRSEIPGGLGALKALALPEFSRARLARSVSVFKSANTDSCKIFKTQQNGTQTTQNFHIFEKDIFSINPSTENR